jgi:PTH1 family peptidyl-tRNA hydrolase
MNLSGESVGPLARFFKIAPEEILVAYDEMAFEPGLVRLKTGGGANGHNGIKSVIDGLGNAPGFHRLRIGVGHPGDKDRVTAYLTSITTPADERRLIEEAFELPEAVLSDLLAGRLQKVMNWLHAPDQIPDKGEQPN